MKEIKIKLAKWLLKKAVKWSEIEPLDFYREFSFEIENKVKEIREIENKMAIDNFKKFYGIYETSFYKSISEQVHRLNNTVEDKRFNLLKNN